MSTATITGFDYRMAPCTGGTFILIDEHPNPNNADHLFDIANMPSTIKLDNKTKFPIKVAIDWKPESNCFGNYITITRIRIII